MRDSRELFLGLTSFIISFCRVLCTYLISRGCLLVNGLAGYLAWSVVAFPMFLFISVLIDLYCCLKFAPKGLPKKTWYTGVSQGMTWNQCSLTNTITCVDTFYSSVPCLAYVVWVAEKSQTYIKKKEDLLGECYWYYYIGLTVQS